MAVCLGETCRAIGLMETKPAVDPRAREAVKRSKTLNTRQMGQKNNPAQHRREREWQSQKIIKS